MKQPNGGITMIKNTIKALLVVGLMLLAISSVTATSYEQVGDLRIANTYYFTSQDYNIIDFEDANLNVGTQYKSQGVDFYGAHSRTIRHDYYNRDNTGTASGEYSIGNSANDGTTSENVPFEITFANGAKAVGFYLGNGAYDNERGVSARITVYDQNGRTLGVLREDDVPNSVTRFVGFSSVGQPIGRVAIDYGTALLSEAIDDLMWVANEDDEVAPIEQDWSCSETDNANDKYERGTTTEVNNNLNTRDVETDYCIDSNTVREYYCGVNGALVSWDTACPNGYSCSSGECVKDRDDNDQDNLRNFQCYDSDGNDIYTKGYVRGLDYYGEKILDESDTCAEYSGGPETNKGAYVMELVCGASEKQTATYKKCTNGYSCSYGKCVQEERSAGQRPVIDVFPTIRKENTLNGYIPIYLNKRMKVYMVDASTNRVIKSGYTSKDEYGDYKVSFTFPAGRKVFFDGDYNGQEYGGFHTPQYDCKEEYLELNDENLIERFINGRKLSTYISNDHLMWANDCEGNTAYVPPTPTYHCGDSAGDDGYYLACEQDTIKHDDGMDLYVHKITQNKVEVKVLNDQYYDIALGETFKFTFDGVRYSVEYNLYNEDTNRVTLYLRSHEDALAIPTVQRTTTVVSEPVDSDYMCGGCQENGNCLPYGTRLVERGTPVYCGVDGSLDKQRTYGQTCQNDYECLSNQCSNGQCVDYGRQIDRTNNLLESILRWLGSIF